MFVVEYLEKDDNETDPDAVNKARNLYQTCMDLGTPTNRGFIFYLFVSISGYLHGAGGSIKHVYPWIFQCPLSTLPSPFFTETFNPSNFSINFHDVLKTEFERIIFLFILI